jgi:hypothetical protein
MLKGRNCFYKYKYNYTIISKSFLKQLMIHEINTEGTSIENQSTYDVPSAVTSACVFNM